MRGEASPLAIRFFSGKSSLSPKQSLAMQQNAQPKHASEEEKSCKHQVTSLVQEWNGGTYLRSAHSARRVSERGR